MAMTTNADTTRAYIPAAHSVYYNISTISMKLPSNDYYQSFSLARVFSYERKFSREEEGGIEEGGPGPPAP